MPKSEKTWVCDDAINELYDYVISTLIRFPEEDVEDPSMHLFMELFQILMANKSVPPTLSLNNLLFNSIVTMNVSETQKAGILVDLLSLTDKSLGQNLSV